MAFDTQRAVVATGDGLVARFPGILCVARCPDAAPVRTLLALCADAAGAHPGRELARRLATWLTGPDAPGDRLAFGTLAAAGDQLAVFLVGAVDAWVDGPGGTALSGADAAIGTDRLLPRPTVPVVLSVGEVRLAPDVADVHDLRSGVVAGSAAVLLPLPARAGDAVTSAEPPADRPAARPVEEPAPDHDWFAARPEPPPLAGRSDAAAWPNSSNGSTTRTNGGSPTANAPRPGSSGRHAILDPAPDLDATDSEERGDDEAESERDLPVDVPGPRTHRPIDVVHTSESEGGRLDTRGPVDIDERGRDRPPQDPDAHDVDAAGYDTHRADAADTAGFGAHRPADAATVGRPLPRPDRVAESATESRSRVPSPVPRPSPGPAGTAVEVSGYLCEQGHLSDPRAPFCGQCGAPVDDRSSGLVSGTRPALGRLVFDDGAAYAVDDGLLVGRLPESDDRVQTGEMRPVVVEDPTGSVSRVHAEIQISGWDVMLLDAGSRNGTFVAGPEDSAWSALPPERGRRLLPGTRVRLGGRTFVYESSSGLR